MMAGQVELDRAQRQSNAGGAAEKTTVSVCALLTSHNRKAATLAALEALFSCELPQGVKVCAVLVDDGSSDGTVSAVAQAFPQVTILEGDGQLFWNRGMHRAFAHALAQKHHYYLWLNDDTVLNCDALMRLFEAARCGLEKDPTPGIVVGATRDPDTGRCSYGGLCRPISWRVLHFEPVAPGEDLVACDTMNGNCVLIPSAAAGKLGNLDWTFEHGMGDFDYGLRARKCGIPLWLAPGFVGYCRANSGPERFLASEPTLKERLRFAVDRKQYPLGAWKAFVRRHAGVFWPLYFVAPYARAMLNAVRSVAHRSKTG